MVNEQLYFLSILCNGLAGFILFTGKDSQPVENTAKFSLQNPTIHLVLGILCSVTGVLKLLSPMKTALLGDLVPAAAGVTAGLLLIFGIYRHDVSSSSEEPSGTLDRLGENLMKFRKTVGLGLLAVALLHFLFPYALFL
uniref:Uncharacterized protein n=1 Tax=uncultured bacterium contig00077 TaxID=1181555 RepID=A0A806JZ15_9BACT|nr:hypothetical protein [uncultured bacterium contig00077]